MQHLDDHSSLDNKTLSLPSAGGQGTAQLGEVTKGRPTAAAPVSKPQHPVQPELPLGLPPAPAKPRRPRSSVHARQLAGLAAFCGRSVSWARTAERRLAAAGIIGHEILVFALVGEAFLRSQGQHRAQQFTQSFNHMIQLLD